MYASSPQPVRADAPPELTARQRELVEWLRLGLRNREIAERMSVRPSTIKTMLERLYRRHGATNRVELLRFLAEQGEAS